MMRSFLPALAVLLFAISPAIAAEPVNQPDLVSFGMGYMNFDKTEAHRQAIDFRSNYTWGMSLLPMISSSLKGLDPYIQFHPFVGGELTGLGQLYGLGGWAMDGYIGRHFVLTWSEGVGFYYPGAAVRLGSFIEFRSQIEVGYRFDNDVRFTLEASHISNAKLTEFNPGAEIVGFYLHMPVHLLGDMTKRSD